MIIETLRLRIKALNLKQFRLLLDGVDKIEQALGLVPSNELLDVHTQQAMDYQYQLALTDTANYLWLTNWQIILKSENKAIGSANFKNSPQENDSVEVGYGIYPHFQNEGYMSEALQAMCDWALKQDDLEYVTAETKNDNYASQKVLQKCGFTNYLVGKDSIWWRIKRK